MKPNYVATKSAIAAINIWLILFSWLIIPLIVLIARIVVAKSYSVEFYDDRMIIKSGVLNKQENQAVFMGVYAVSISQTLMGRIFGYGNITVDCPGKWDIDTVGVADPQGLKRYLETKITRAGVTNIIHN